MSQESCGFCQKLPPLARNRAGQPSRCPACKQEIWIGPGATYRLLDDEPGCCRGWQVAGVVSFSIILLALAGKSLWPMKPAVTPISVAHEPAAEAPVVETPRNEIQIVEFNKKWPIPSYAARVKAPGDGIRPKLPPDAKGWDKGEPGPLMAEVGLPRMKVKTELPAKPLAVKLARTQHAKDQLNDIPEVDLDPAYMKRSKLAIEKLANDIDAHRKKNPDAFVRQLIAERSDLAGLSFLLGKDCQLSSEEAGRLQQAAAMIRAAQSKRLPSPESKHWQSDGIDPVAESFWMLINQHTSKTSWKKGELVSAFEQILTTENRSFRLPLVQNIASIKTEKGLRFLARRALFDTDEDVRAAAIKGLADRPSGEFVPLLLDGLRYPWASVVNNAAEAVVALRLTGIVPQLAAMLGDGEPGRPFQVVDSEGKSKTVIHELVRINHHRNCLLCHAPANGIVAEIRAGRARAPLLALVPLPENTLPSMSTPVYYSTRPGDIVVRADITYLRQDFSLMQPVANPGNWPKMQRFDFFVRTRELTEEEAKRFPQPDATKPSEYKQTIAWALSELTGLNAPPEAAAWRAALSGWRSPGAAAAKSSP